MANRSTDQRSTGRSLRQAGHAAATLLALAVAVTALAWTWQDAFRTPPIDFYQHWLIPQAVAQHWCPNIYSVDGRSILGRRSYEIAQDPDTPAAERAGAQAIHDIVNFYSPTPTFQTVEPVATPFYYTCFHWFTTGDFAADYQRFVLARLVCLALGSVLLCQMLGYSWAGTFVAVALFAGACEPLRQSDLPFGNVNLLQFGALAAFIGLESRSRQPAAWFAGGLILGFAVLFKPNLLGVAFMAPLLWILHQRWKQVQAASMGMLLAGAYALGLAAWFFGSLACWKEWATAASRLMDDPRGVRTSNIGLATVLKEWLGIDVSLALLVAASLLVLIAWRSGRTMARKKPAAAGPSESEQRISETFLAVGLGLLVYFLVHRMVWWHYFVLVVPMLLYFWRPRPRWAALTGADAILYEILVILALIAFSPLPRLVGLASNNYAIAAWCDGGAGVLFALSLWELQRLEACT